MNTSAQDNSDIVETLLITADERIKATFVNEEVPKFLKVIVKLTISDGYLMAKAAEEITRLRKELESK